MPFVGKKEAFQILDEMLNGTCSGDCRKIWLRNIGYALKTNTNPLHLTPMEHKKMLTKLAEVKHRKKHGITRKMDKKYLTRNSPPYPANEHCGEIKKGNDGTLYRSVPDKHNICRWKHAD
jgi:hypothetical protein